MKAPLDYEDDGYWLADSNGNPKGHPDWRPWNAPLEQRAPAAQRWYGFVLVLAITSGLVLAAFAIKEMMTWLL